MHTRSAPTAPFAPFPQDKPASNHCRLQLTPTAPPPRLSSAPVASPPPTRLSRYVCQATLPTGSPVQLPGPTGAGGSAVLRAVDDGDVPEGQTESGVMAVGAGPGNSSGGGASSAGAGGPSSGVRSSGGRGSSSGNRELFSDEDVWMLLGGRAARGSASRGGASAGSSQGVTGGAAVQGTEGAGHGDLALLSLGGRLQSGQVPALTPTQPLPCATPLPGPARGPPAGEPGRVAACGAPELPGADAPAAARPSTGLPATAGGLAALVQSVLAATPSSASDGVDSPAGSAGSQQQQQRAAATQPVAMLDGSAAVRRTGAGLPPAPSALHATAVTGAPGAQPPPAVDGAARSAGGAPAAGAATAEARGDAEARQPRALGPAVQQQAGAQGPAAALAAPGRSARRAQRPADGSTNPAAPTTLRDVLRTGRRQRLGRLRPHAAAVAASAGRAATSFAEPVMAAADAGAAAAVEQAAPLAQASLSHSASAAGHGGGRTSNAHWRRGQRQQPRPQPAAGGPSAAAATAAPPCLEGTAAGAVTAAGGDGTAAAAAAAAAQEAAAGATAVAQSRVPTVRAPVEPQPLEGRRQQRQQQQRLPQAGARSVLLRLVDDFLFVTTSRSGTGRTVGRWGGGRKRPALVAASPPRPPLDPHASHSPCLARCGWWHAGLPPRPSSSGCTGALKRTTAAASTRVRRPCHAMCSSVCSSTALHAVVRSLAWV